MRLVNLTGFTICVMDENGKDVKFRIPNDYGNTAKAQIKTKPVRTIIGEGDLEIEICDYEYDAIEGLPEPIEGTMYLVPYSVLQALKGTRRDVISPDTSPLSVCRDAQHKMVGIRRFRTLEI